MDKVLISTNTGSITRKYVIVKAINLWIGAIAVSAVYLKRLRDLREDHDMTQRDVAKLLGIAQTVYSRYERGFQSLPLSHLITLCKFYGVSADYILGLSENPHQEVRKGCFSEHSKSDL